MKRIALAVIAFVVLACGCQVDLYVPAEAAPTLVTHELSGRHVNIFGEDAFVDKTKREFETYGANVMIEEDLIGALQLSGDGYVMLYCIDPAGRQTIITSPSPMLIMRSSVVLSSQCVNGIVLVGFGTQDVPDIELLPDSQS